MGFSYKQRYLYGGQFMMFMLEMYSLQEIYIYFLGNLSLDFNLSQKLRILFFRESNLHSKSDIETQD